MAHLEQNELVRHLFGVIKERMVNDATKLEAYCNQGGSCSPSIWCDPCEGYPSVYVKLKKADVAPVVHGRWIFDNYTKRLRCSECEAYKPYEMVGDIVDYWDCDYCPNCGARMDGE